VLLGMTSSRLALLSTPLIDYTASEREIYTRVIKLLLPLELADTPWLLVESPHRPVNSKELPSWVPDWMTDQSIGGRLIYFASTISGISATRNEPSNKMKIRRESAFTIEEDTGILALSGVFVGVVTAVHTFNLEYNWEESSKNTMGLFQYSLDANREAHHNLIPKIPWDQSRNMYNTSWGPFWVETGDLIIISTTCRTPMVIRRNGDSYLFVGGCWLIDRVLQGPGDGIANRFAAKELINDPGTSSIMRGSTWDESKVETFRIE
jgi:hypothetical protein